MSFIKKAMASGAGDFMDKASKAIKRFVTTDKDRMELEVELEELLQERDGEVEKTIRKELEAKERVMVAELEQGDSYTKRARPTVVYAGLLFIACNYVLFPMLGDLFAEKKYVPTQLPFEFWVAWGGICSVWSLGRTAEKRGMRNQLVQAITGNKTKSRLLD